MQSAKLFSSLRNPNSDEETYTVVLFIYMYFVLPSFPPVLRIREIFLQIRIRMRVLGSVPHKSEYSRYQGGFSYYFCLMIEGSGAWSVLVTNGSGRPENIRIRIGMRIRNNASHPPPLYEITIVGHNPHKWRNFKIGVMRHLQTIPVILFNS